MAQKILDPLSETAISKPVENGANGSTQNGDSSHADVPPELLAELAEIRRLLEASEVPAARRIARELPLRWPESRQAAKVAELLGPSRARTLPAAKAFIVDHEQDWLRRNAHRYPGCWLAVLGDKLIAAEPHLNQVLAQIRVVPGGDQALLHYQPVEFPPEP